MIFSEKIFNLREESEYSMKQIDMNNPSLRNYEFLSFAPAYKEEYQKEKAIEEFILSYVEAAKKILENNQKDLNIILQIKTYSLSIPALFLCRHAIELSIKYGIEILGNDYKAIHSITDLWQLFEDSFDKNNCSDGDIEIFDKMKSFINIISKFDNENGTKLRYPVNKNDKLNVPNLIFVNLKVIIQTTELFVKQMMLVKLK